MSIFRSIARALFRSSHEEGDLRVDVSTKTRKKGRANLLKKMHEKATPHGRLSTELDNNTARSTLAQLAAELRRLPKVMPRLAWRERLRGRLVSIGAPHWVFQFAERVVAVAVVALLVVGVFATSLLTTVPPTLAEAGQLTVEGGDVLVRDPGATFFAPAAATQVVYAGTAVRVSTDARARLDLLDDSRIELAQDTEVTIASVDQTADDAAPEVRVAVLTGQVSTPARATGRVHIETPAGTVSAGADTTIAVDERGEASVQSESEVFVQLATGDATLVPAGQSARIAAGDVELIDPAAALLPAEPLDFTTLATRIDIAHIRMFDALAYAQNGDTDAAQVLAQRVTDELDDMLAQLEISGVTDGRADALRLALSSQAPVGLFAVMDLELTVITDVQKLLAYYQVSPELLRGAPAFDIVTRSKYSASPVLQRLFAAVRTQQLARETARPLSDQLIAHTVQLYTVQVPTQLRRSLSEMRTQPVYLPALLAWQSALTVDTDEHARVTTAITQLEEALAAYAGAVAE